MADLKDAHEDQETIDPDGRDDSSPDEDSCGQGIAPFEFAADSDPDFGEVMSADEGMVRQRRASLTKSRSRWPAMYLQAELKTLEKWMAQLDSGMTDELQRNFAQHVGRVRTSLRGLREKIIRSQGQKHDEEINDWRRYVQTQMRDLRVNADKLGLTLQREAETAARYVTRPLTVTTVRSAKAVRGKIRLAFAGDEQVKLRQAAWDAPSYPKLAKFLDKWTFLLGVANFAVTEAIVLMRPDFFWLWYLLTLPLLIIVKFLYYRTQKWEFFLLDFCYLVNSACCVAALVTPSCRFFKILFACIMGPISIAILVYRNAVVFHDVDRMSSFYIHIFPPLLFFTLRYPVPEASALDPFAFSSGWRSAMPSSFSHLQSCDGFDRWDAANVLLFYLFWQVLYHLATEVVWKSRLDGDPDLLTSLRYLASNEKNFMTNLALKFSRKLCIMGVDEKFDTNSWKTKLVFAAAHMVYTVALFVFVPLFWASRSATILYILILVSRAVFAGGSFYIEVFSRKYQDKFLGSPRLEGTGSSMHGDAKTE